MVNGSFWIKMVIPRIVILLYAMLFAAKSSIFRWKSQVILRNSTINKNKYGKWPFDIDAKIVFRHLLHSFFSLPFSWVCNVCVCVSVYRFARFVIHCTLIRFWCSFTQWIHFRFFLTSNLLFTPIVFSIFFHSNSFRF